MINHYDIAYGLGVGLSAPYWLARPTARRKVLGALSRRMGHIASRDLSKPAVMIHAVSLGEINATRALVASLRRRKPGLHFVISTTTDTGLARGAELYGTDRDVSLVQYPLDFSPAVDRLLNAMQPAVVALMELEVWPNFVRRCQQRSVPVVLINGRMTEASYRKYRLARPLVGSMFARLRRVCAQDETIARRFIDLGAAADRVSVTGTMKFDNAAILDTIPGAAELAAATGLRPGKEPIWVCGSTGPGEEQLILNQYRKLLAKFPTLRVAIIPRHPRRFDEVADLISAANFPVVRRSSPSPGTPGEGRGEGLLPVILGDTMGELIKFYAIADVIFVGRTLVDLGDRQHGSDMIEPAALAKPIVVGPFTANFAAPMRYFTEAKAMKVVQTGDELRTAIDSLLSNPTESSAMSARARQVVQSQQGATERHVKVILDELQ